MAAPRAGDQSDLVRLVSRACVPGLLLGKVALSCPPPASAACTSQHQFMILLQYEQRCRWQIALPTSYVCCAWLVVGTKADTKVECLSAVATCFTMHIA